MAQSRLISWSHSRCFSKPVVRVLAGCTAAAFGSQRLRRPGSHVVLSQMTIASVTRAGALSAKRSGPTTQQLHQAAVLALTARAGFLGAI